MSANIENSLLQALQTCDRVFSDALAEQLGVAHQDVVGAAKSLESEEYITAEMHSRPTWKLTHEAEQVAELGSPEYRLWQLLGEQSSSNGNSNGSNGSSSRGDAADVASAETSGMSQSAVQERLGKAVAGIAVANGLKSKLLTLSKHDGVAYLARHPDAATTAVDHTREMVRRAQHGDHVDPRDADMLKKRQLGALEVRKVFAYGKGAKYAPARRAKPVGDLTREMLLDGSWKTATFKEYNFAASAAEVDGGQLHPLLKVRQEFREILMELGFQEMNTQHWVESSFWNFDSLFIPQQHPARDVQDTFFISKPSTTQLDEADPLLQAVRAQHTQAFRGAWRLDEAQRNVLRTHTTGTSAYTLRKLAAMSPKDEHGRVQFRPGRYYSIDRVFRNEEMDRTHLCEFHQVEGFVIDRDISLAKMMHTFNAFFRRIGVEQLRFKPTYNPYTEPSMEVFGFHAGMQKWIEVGNSGLFRPEMLRPLGYDEDVAVMAWGLSLERPTMIKHGLNSIHELFGHRVDIRFIKRSAITRF